MASLTILSCQAGAIFLVAFAWFLHGVPSVWQHVRAEQSTSAMAEKWSMKSSPRRGMLDSQRQFATVAAVTHTAVLLLGFAAARLGAEFIWAPRSSRSLWPRLIRLPAARWAAVVIGVLAFFFGLYTFFRYSFEKKIGITYRYAASFFYERGGSTPFAVVSSLSYGAFFAAGMVIKQACPRYAVDGLFPPVVMRWAPAVVRCFVAAMVTFHFAVFPIYERLVKPVIRSTLNDTCQLAENADDGADFTEHFALLATFSHTVALVLGMFLCWLAREGVRALARAETSRESAAKVVSASVNIATAISIGLALLLALSRMSGFELSIELASFMTTAALGWLKTQLQYLLTTHILYANTLAGLRLGFGAGEMAGVVWSHYLLTRGGRMCVE